MQILRYILFPFSIVYWFITTIRNYLYTIGVIKSNDFDTPVIVVGNLSVGGTGKTPMVEYLVRLLMSGKKVAILSRGYKRRSKGFVLANENATAQTIGDEPFQYYNKFKNVLVAVDANRTNGINKLINYKPDVIILDDAFQHRKVKADCNILLSTYNDLYVDDYLLPTGNLRESRSGAKRAEAIIITKCPNSLSKNEQKEIIEKIHPSSKQKVFFSTIEYSEELKGVSSIEIKNLKGKEVLLVTGIAYPKPLLKYLEEKNLKITHLKFPDHHHFTTKDIEKIKAVYNSFKGENSIILTTEKDYVRIIGRINNLHYISIKIKIINQNKDFKNLINSYVG